MSEPPLMSWCSRGQHHRPLSEFGNAKDGRGRYWCKGCNAAYTAANRDRRRAREQASRTAALAVAPLHREYVHVTEACPTCVAAHGDGHRCAHCGSRPGDAPWPEDACPRCEPRL